MNKLSLNFFGEQVEVKLPETLASLRQNISEKFLFSPSDTAELVISYAKDVGKKIIETENDFKEFIKNKVFKVDLDVDQNSQIFKKSLIKLQTEKEADKKELETLLNKSKELENEKKSKLLEAKKKIDELTSIREKKEKEKKDIISKYDREIKKIKSDIAKMKEKADVDKKDFTLKEDELNKSINDLKEKLGIPIEKKEKKPKYQKKPKLKSCKKVVKKVKNQKKEDQQKLLETIQKWGDLLKANADEITKNLSKKYEEYKMFFIPQQEEQKQEIHWNYICDGCGMAPIKGIRYHCSECEDYDFCEKCHAEKKHKEGHKFLTIEKSVIKPPERKLRAPRFVCDKKVVHRNVTCDGCGVYPIVGCRYKCAVCPDFDFCENCEKKMSVEHSHPMILIPNPNMKLFSIKCNLKEEYKIKKENEHVDIIHAGISCDGCNAECIVGTRYKCAVCPNFDYCEKCLKEHTLDHQHPFIKIYHPKMKIASIKAVVPEDCPVFNPQAQKVETKECQSEKEDKHSEKLKSENYKNLLVDHDGPVHDEVTCDGCGMYPIVGCRYKCAICPNFDYCEKCEKKYYKEHSHPMLQIPSPEMELYSIKCNLKNNFKMDDKKNEHNDIVHDGINCNGCDAKCIVGNRYKCSICQNFDYCEKCLKKYSSEHKHPFIKIYHPKMKLVSIKVVVGEKCPIYKPKEEKEEKKEETEETEKNEKNDKNEKDVHEGYICDGCGVAPIIGVRYKCAVCNDFDLCEKCEELNKNHLHPFIKIYHPDMKIDSIKCIVKEDFPVYK